MNLRRIALVPGLIGMLLSGSPVQAAVPQTSSPSSSQSSGGSSGQLSIREIYRRGYLAGYRAAYRKFRGESRTTALPSGNDSFSMSTALITESAMAGGNISILRLLPKFTLSEDFSIGAQLEAGMTFGNEDPAANATKVRDGKLIVKHSGARLSKVVKYSTSLELALPISEASREEKTLITGITPIPRLDFDWSPLGAKGLTSYFRLALTRNFHSSETTRTSSPVSNNRYTVIPKGGIAYSILPPLGIEVGFGREFYWDYESALTERYELYQELGFSVTKSFSIALGHYTYNTLSDSVSVELASKQASNVYGVFSYSF